MNGSEGSLIAVYLVYVPVAVGLTVWLARMLYQHGTVFLDDVFPDRPALAKAINRLLVTGFYMLNLGYAFLILRARPTESVVGAIEELVTKLGVLLASLAVLHLLNVFIFDRIRRTTAAATAPPPVPPTAYWTPPGAYAHAGAPTAQPHQSTPEPARDPGGQTDEGPWSTPR